MIVKEEERSDSDAEGGGVIVNHSSMKPTVALVAAHWPGLFQSCKRTGTVTPHG
jgi:hypothetical protein